MKGFSRRLLRLAAVVSLGAALASGRRIRIYVDDQLAVATFSRGPKSYYFKCGVYSRKGSARSETRYRNVNMWVKHSHSPAK